jgi:hypothetical protein
LAKQKSVKEKTKQSGPAEPAVSIPEVLPSPGRQRAIMLGAGLAALALCLAIYLLRLDQVVGLVVDDAWYVLLAKALATGQGYTLINSPSPGIVPFYSPGFPALLSIFYRLSPNFPNNVWLLKSVSIAAMMGVGWLAYGYYKRDRELPVWVSYLLALAVTLFPAIVFLATSTVMSESVFMLVQLGVIVLAERGVREGALANAWRWTALAGALAGFAFLTRPAGIGLLVACALYLFKARLTRQALIFAAIVAVVAGPWMLYSRAHAPTPEQRAEQGANIVQPYTAQLWQKVAGQPLSGTIDAGDLPGRIGDNLYEIIFYDFGGFAFFPAYRPMEPGEPMRVPSQGRMLSLLLALLALAGYLWAVLNRLTLAELVVPLSIGVTLLWGWEQFRLLLPLTPFLLFYLVMGVRAITAGIQKMKTDPAGSSPHAGRLPLLVAAGLLAFVNLYGNIKYIQKKYDPVPEYRLRWPRAYDENVELMTHIRNNVPKDDIIATQNPALLHLFSGHKTVASDDPAGSWDTWNRIGVKHLARTSPLPLPKADAAESQYRTVFRTSGFLNLRLVDLGSPSSRPAWGK